jgi:predicted DNA-binding protein YlxM (UPF0122 family)
MIKKDNIKYSELWIFYKSLFTSKQNKYLRDYFLNDFSLDEIAKKNRVSKTAISDVIKRTKQTLDDYEQKLKLFKNSNSRIKIYKKIPNKDIRNKLILLEESN